MVGGLRVDAADGRPLGAAPPAWQSAIRTLPDDGTLRLPQAADGGAAPAQAWPAVLMRLDAGRVAVLASPDYALAAGDVVRLVLVAFALTGSGVAGFVALFLFVFRRRFAGRSAERLSPGWPSSPATSIPCRRTWRRRSPTGIPSAQVMLRQIEDLHRRPIATRPAAAGIGLQVVRRPARAMRGSLLLEATEEGGTRATVRLSTAAPQVRGRR